MSASDKKKLRKEQSAAFVTEKQRTEQKKQKKQTAYTVTFIVAMVLVLAIFLTTVLSSPIRNLWIQASTAVTVNDHTIGGREFNYFYVDSMRSWCSSLVNQYGNYASMMMQWSGFNPTLPVGDQVIDEKTGETWADYFSKAAIESAKWTYGMYDEALAKGFKLTTEQEKSLTDYEAGLKAQAANAGVSVNKYIQSTFGGTANLKSYMEYYKITVIATLYASEYYGKIEFEPEQLREYEKDKYHEYSSYSYATYTVTVSDYLTGGTTSTGEDGKTNITYSDEEREAAIAAALEAAKLLTEDEKIVDDTTFNLAIKEMAKGNTKECTKISETLYSSLSITNEEMKEWVTDSERKAGEMKYFTNSTKTDDKETVTSYTVVLFLSRNDNTSKEGNVLHLLVKFEGGKTTNGVTTYTDEEKKAAKDEAEKLLKEYEAGEKTKEAFIELLTKHTDDVDKDKKPNNGGLYENITPASNYVAEFENWAYADHKPGDTGIIETTYGYHIMYYVEDGENTYRDLLIEADMANEKYTAWEKAIVDGVKVVESKNVVVNEDFIIPTTFYSTGYSY